MTATQAIRKLRARFKQRQGCAEAVANVFAKGGNKHSAGYWRHEYAFWSKALLDIDSVEMATRHRSRTRSLQGNVDLAGRYYDKKHWDRE